jgi:hypothetical protein
VVAFPADAVYTRRSGTRMYEIDKIDKTFSLFCEFLKQVIILRTFSLQRPGTPRKWATKNFGQPIFIINL